MKGEDIHWESYVENDYLPPERSIYTSKIGKFPQIHRLFSSFEKLGIPLNPIFDGLSFGIKFNMFPT